MKKYCYPVFIMFTLSCANPKDNSTLAIIDNQSISQIEVDSLINSSLLEELDKIYALRKGSLENIISQKLMLSETKKSGLTIQNYFNNYFKEKITELLVSEEIAKHKYDSIVTGEANGHLCAVPINSEHGKIFLIQDIKQNLTNQLYDSLKKKYNVQVLLDPPLKQYVNTSNCLRYEAGNPESKIALTMISDFDCKNCIAIYPMFEKIFEKYKSKIKFEFIFFAEKASLKAIFAEGLKQQRVDYELISKLYIKTKGLDTLALYDIIGKSNFDMNHIKQSFADTSLKEKINYGIEQLRKQGIRNTPSFLINGRLISSYIDGNDLENLIISNLRSE